MMNETLSTNGCCIKGCDGTHPVNVICDIHRHGFRRLPKSTQRQIMIYWHESVIEPYKEGEMYRCHYCGKLFPRNEICGDHMQSRGARSDLKFSVTNGCACCVGCNRSDSIFRRNPAELTRL